MSRYRSQALVAVAVALIGIGCVGTRPPAPSFDVSPSVDPTVLALPAAPYYEVVWASHDVIVAVSDLSDAENPQVELFDRDGVRLRMIELADSQSCSRRIVVGLSRMSDGKFAFTKVCIRYLADETSRVYEVDVSTLEQRELPQPVQSPGRMAWSPDGSELIYQAGLGLCWTLYRQTPTTDEPLPVSVAIDGQTVWLGEELDDGDEHCLSSAESHEPAINPADGSLAAFVKPIQGSSGQHMIDEPWTLVVATDGEAEPVLGGLRDAYCLAWANDGDLLFSANLERYGQTPDGVYRVERDGTGLRQIGTRALDFCSLSPDGSSLIGTDGESWPPPEDMDTPVAVLSYAIE